MEVQRLTQEELKRNLHYNPESGIFVWMIDKYKPTAGMVAGSMHKTGYIYIIINGRSYKAHRLAWLYMNGSFPDGDIDHVDGVRDNNAFDNLREADRSENLQNLRKARADSGTGLMGAGWCKAAGKYRSRITINGKQIYLGLYDTAEEAHKAYIKAKRELHSFCTI